MSAIANEELVRKATIVADNLATGGKLSNAQSDRFIDFVVDETVLKDNARVVRFRNESLEIDKIGVGRRVAVPKKEAVDPQVRRGITTTKITITPRELMVPFEIGDNFRELNIEGDSIEETIIRMMSTQLANDLEDLYINGNKLGPAVPQAEILEGGSDDEVKDTYLALTDGWGAMADQANVVDAQGMNVGLSIFSRAIRALPTKFRRNRNALRWFMSPDLWQLYMEKLATRATPLGDAAATGGRDGLVGPFGIPAVPVPLWGFEPLQVEHVQLNGTTPVALKNSNITDLVVHNDDLEKIPTPSYTETTDYVVNAAAGTIARAGGGAIADGDVVKVTYRSGPQLILTHQNNFVIGIGRDIRIEKDRDIYKGVNQYAITTKVDVGFEELGAIVKVRNIGKGI
jgi:hypothetical protein